MADFDILGIGHSCYDTFGLLNVMPLPDTAVWLDAMECQGGGAATQAMVAAARLGMKTAIAAVLGDDPEGLYLKGDFEREGINIEGLRIVPGAGTSRAFAVVEGSTGRRTLFVYAGSLPELTLEDGLKQLILRSRMLHLDATVYQLALDAAVFAKGRGIPVSLDGCEDGAGREKIRALVETTDILIGNEWYPRSVTGLEDPEEALLTLARMGPGVVISTRGKGGAWLADRGRLKKFPPYPVPVTDTTGAGDVFHGAFLAAYLRGMTAERAVSYASAAAAINCMTLGGRRGIPHRKTLDAFMRERGFLKPC
ncbi:MAG: carbohydrate kinase family protein [Treponema sp.]|jgi:sugar/nucleoside kinase (ribokinase family)|nr:carbohydrate kinase family protein [Treponema sp.]